MTFFSLQVGFFDGFSRLSRRSSPKIAPIFTFFVTYYAATGCVKAGMVLDPGGIPEGTVTVYDVIIAEKENIVKVCDS